MGTRCTETPTFPAERNTLPHMTLMISRAMPIIGTVMHDRITADPRQSRATTAGALALAVVVSVAVSIIGILIIRPCAGGVSD